MGTILDYPAEMARLIPSRAPPVNRGSPAAAAAGRAPSKNTAIKGFRALGRLAAAFILVCCAEGALAQASRAPDADQAELDPAQLFQAVAGSVHLVAAVSSLDDIKAKRNINQGSAVAISDRELVTNCHVVKDKALVYLLRDGHARPAQLGRSDPENDLCTLLVAGGGLVPVGRVRPFSSLAVGERVYTIGSPRGLENTLGDGLVAGLRKRGSARLVQITAPISQGSSGGGLFDRFGNLVGITSFFLNESQSINFAIAIDDFAAIASLPAAVGGQARIVALPPTPTPVNNAASGKGFRLELTVARTDKEALDTWAILKERYGDLLAGLKPETQHFDVVDKGSFVRLLAGFVPERGKASTLCREITQRGHATCTVR